MSFEITPNIAKAIISIGIILLVYIVMFFTIKLINRKVIIKFMKCSVFRSTKAGSV